MGTYFAAAEKLVPPTPVPGSDDSPASVAPTAEDAEAGGDDGDGGPSNLRAIQRLFSGSTQFLFCDDFTDLDCLEKDPALTPSPDFRKPVREGLGNAIDAGDSLNMEVFFTKAWDGVSPVFGVANKLAEKLRTDVGKSLSVAMYGIDDINGSMKPVYDAIHEFAKNPNVSVRSVVDIAALEKNEKKIDPVSGKSQTDPWIFSYTNAPEPTGKWLLGKSAKNPEGMHATFQYDGTPSFIRDLNQTADGQSIANNEDSRVRLEWPKNGIMHNKYAVLEDASGHKAVWSGTANISNHCMGTERNSNMSVYVKNDAIAQAYLDEFNLMFNFDSKVDSTNQLVANSDPTQKMPVGRFHHNKYPVSNRLFNFKDGTRFRVHFAPTDDAEHRVILPMLLSAKEGDEIRISMFGGTGYEIVRAMQYAAAKGANIRIVFDSMLSKGPTSWVRDPKLRLSYPNPYIGKIPAPKVPGKIDVRISNWEGKNHYKAGTLVRRQPDGSKVAEELIVGSQNWSSGGNDSNDENLMSIQNLRTSVPAAVAFNQEFDSHLWVVAGQKKEPAVAPVKVPKGKKK